MVVFIDKQANNNGPSWTSLYTGTDVTAFRDLDYRKRYTILWQRIIYIDADDPNRDWRMYKKLDMKTVYDDSSSGLIGDISTNSLYFGIISEFGTNSPGIDMDTRLRYIDN